MMLAAAAALAESARYAPTLSMDEPMHAVAGWRLFMAAGWQATALSEAMPATAVAAFPEEATA